MLSDLLDSLMTASDTEAAAINKGLLAVLPQLFNDKASINTLLEYTRVNWKSGYKNRMLPLFTACAEQARVAFGIANLLTDQHVLGRYRDHYADYKYMNEWNFDLKNPKTLWPIMLQLREKIDQDPTVKEAWKLAGITNNLDRINETYQAVLNHTTLSIPRHTSKILSFTKIKPDYEHSDYKVEHKDVRANEVVKVCLR